METKRRTQRSEKPALRLQIARQIAIFLENRPGVLARVCDAFAEHKINIFAISTSDAVDHAVIRMVVSDPAAALRLLEERGALAVTTEVLMIDGSNKPGSLAAIAHRLAKARINIDYAYSATHPSQHKGLLILRVSNPRKALKALNT